MVLAGGYAAISPWVIGFSGSTTPLAINDLIVGVAIVVMTLICADSRGRMYGMAWVAPVMLALFLIGLAWIVVFYVTDGSLPIDALGNWNIVVGFGFIAAEDGTEVFFHVSALQDGDSQSLREGQGVEFQVGQGPKGKRAENLKLTK